MTPEVHVLVGMISSGKSTYALNAARAGFVVVNDDSICESIHGGDYSLYDKACKTIYKSIGISILTHAIALGKSVVIDTGSRNRTTRARWVSLAKALDVPVYAIEFPIEHPTIHARRRADSDGRGFGYEKWLEVAHRHWEELDFEPIDHREGFTDIIDAHWPMIQQGWYHNFTGQLQETT